MSGRRALHRLESADLDLLVVGAGIVGSRIAYEAAHHGLPVGLVDAGDFGGGTSSDRRSSSTAACATWRRAICGSSETSRRVIAFATGVRINRRIEEVFAYVSDPLGFPRWNSAVRAVQKTSAGQNGAASTYSMERELPSGRAVNELEVVASEPRESSQSARQPGRRRFSTATRSLNRTARQS